jgi:hypothetical protein
LPRELTNCMFCWERCWEVLMAPLYAPKTYTEPAAKFSTRAPRRTSIRLDEVSLIVDLTCTLLRLRLVSDYRDFYDINFYEKTRNRRPRGLLCPLQSVLSPRCSPLVYTPPLFQQNDAQTCRVHRCSWNTPVLGTT